MYNEKPPCRYFMSGKICRWGDQCRFSHDPALKTGPEEPVSKYIFSAHMNLGTVDIEPEELKYYYLTQSREEFLGTYNRIFIGNYNLLKSVYAEGRLVHFINAYNKMNYIKTSNRQNNYTSNINRQENHASNTNNHASNSTVTFSHEDKESTAKKPSDTKFGFLDYDKN